MEQTLPANVTNHYRRNEDTYSDIRERLADTRQTFPHADKSEQIQMLQKSHSFAVISVQTPVAIHESAFDELWANDTPSEDIAEALSSVNYRNNKERYIRHSLRNGHKWAEVADMLEAGEVDTAHKLILDEFMGVGPAKAPFTLSMLGFTDKMCIDANIVNAMGMDDHVSTVVVEKYDQICQRLRDKMPTLSSMVSPFMWQWATFSFQRGGEVETHDVFFKAVLYGEE